MVLHSGSVKKTMSLCSTMHVLYFFFLLLSKGFPCTFSNRYMVHTIYIFTVLEIHDMYYENVYIVYILSPLTTTDFRISDGIPKRLKL